MVFIYPRIPLDFWSKTTGLKTFCFDSDRLRNPLDFWSISDELEEFGLDWIVGKTNAGCLKRASTLSVWNDLKVFKGVWCSLWHLYIFCAKGLLFCMLLKLDSEGHWEIFCSCFFWEICLRSGKCSKSCLSLACWS